MNVYNFTVKDAKGNDVSLADYKGKVLLIVNTATQCGFTPQYKELQELYVACKEKGFEILDFPCNQFGHQAPGSNDELVGFCQMKYNTTFRTFGKVDVNGNDAHPLFNYLKEEAKGILGNLVKWNFTKFLVTREGNVVKRFAPITVPSKIKSSIEELL